MLVKFNCDSLIFLQIFLSYPNSCSDKFWNQTIADLIGSSFNYFVFAPLIRDLTLYLFSTDLSSRGSWRTFVTLTLQYKLFCVYHESLRCFQGTRIKWNIKISTKLWPSCIEIKFIDTLKNIYSYSCCSTITKESAGIVTINTQRLSYIENNNAFWLY